MKRTIIGAIVAAVVVLLIAFIMLPVISLKFIDLAILAVIFAVVMVFTGYLVQFRKRGNHQHAKIGGAIFAVAILFIIVATVSSSAIFKAKQKQQMLDVEEIVFDESVPNVDMNNLIIWDEVDAIRFGEKLITQKDASLGSMYSISQKYGTLSVVNGKPYWLFPLEHSGFFKYLKNKTIPGYIKVNATTGKAEFVEKQFKVAPSAYLSNDLKRVVYSKYKGFGLTDYSFEEDSKGNPKWVITAYTHKAGVATSQVLGTVIVDPITKDVNFYEKGKQPDWVDRVSSVGIFSEHLKNWGKLVNGWWNPSDTGKLKNTNGIGYVFKDNNIYFYTGITSYGGDEATTGFLIYNPRTAKAQYNRISGSTEQKAMGLMEELVQNAGYKAKYPYLINVNGEATYLSTLKGNSGNVVGYALCSVKNYRAVAWGKTLREAQTEYNRILITEGGSSSLNNQYNTLEKSNGKVVRVGVYKDGYFIIKLDTSDLLYVVSVDQFPTIALTEKGDEVSISFLKTNANKIDAIEFVNNSIK